MEKKMLRSKKRKAQSTLEYFLISAAVISAFIGAAFLSSVKYNSFVKHFEKCRDKIVGEE
ncbi:MAG: hypothetical protein KBB01_00530 [Candidatus Omnitrophica bacterium]|jgi:uncharacterized protein (UPF0333 family)|nr:hypothetical protein [Candidatus Omnitrophota bacterium]